MESYTERPTDGFGATIDALQIREIMPVVPVGIAQAAEDGTAGWIDGVRSPLTATDRQHFAPLTLKPESKHRCPERKKNGSQGLGNGS